MCFSARRISEQFLMHRAAMAGEHSYCDAMATAVLKHYFTNNYHSCRLFSLLNPALRIASHEMIILISETAQTQTTTIFMTNGFPI